MKIEVRRKITNGLVICLQASAILPKVADTAAQTIDAIDLNSFVANQVDSLPNQSEAKFEIAVNEGDSKGGNSALADQLDGDPLGGDPTGGDPTGGDPTGGDPTGGDPTGGDPTGGDPTGGDPTGGDPTGGDPTGGDPTGGDPTGGDPTGGDPTGGDPTGGDPTGGDPTGGDPTGGDPTGGDPTGGDPTGGDPTGGDPTGGDPTGGDPTGGDPTGGDPTGGDPTGGDPTGGDPTGGDPTGGDPTGGDPTGGDPTGGDPTGGDPTGGDPTGGDPTGGDPTGGDPTGGDPTGGDPTGGDPTGGDPTGGDPTGGDPTGGDPTGGDPTGGDPTGGDPTGGDPSGCDPSASEPKLVVTAPDLLITEECGGSAQVKVSLSAQPISPELFTLVSSHPDEALALPSTLVFLENACQPRIVEIKGQSDGVFDGDVAYTIEFQDVDGNSIISLNGINTDNDNIPDLVVDVQGPPSLMPGENGIYMVRLSNLAATLTGYTLVIETTPGLNLTGFACTYLSGSVCDNPFTLTDNKLQLENVDLAGDETLLLSIDTQMQSDNRDQAILSARFVEAASGMENDDCESTPIAIFRSSFENE